MALTLIEAAKLGRGTEFQRAIVATFVRETALMRVLPFKNILGNALRYNQEQTMPGIGFRGLNEAFAESTGVVNPVTETLAIAGGDLDVDVVTVKTEGAEARAVHEAMKLKHLGQAWSQKFIKGDTQTTPAEFDGLQRRLTGNQLIANPLGGGMSLLSLDAAIDAVDNPTHLMMTKANRRHMTAAARSATLNGNLVYEKDQFGFQIAHYNGLPIIEADENGALAALDYSEGSGEDETSVYVLSLRDQYLVGIQNSGPEARDLGEIDDKPVLRTRVEWLAGVALYHPRAAARMSAITNVACVA